MMTNEQRITLQRAAIDNRNARRDALMEQATSVPMIREYVSAHSGQVPEKAFVQKIVVKEYEAA